MYFAVPKDPGDRKHPSTWPCATVCVDQGSDGWCALHFLVALGLNLIILFDWKHRTWNDVQLSLKDSNLWLVVVLTTVILNVDRGPWNNHTWWEELKAGTAEYMKVGSSKCKIFQGCIHGLMRDQGLRGRCCH